MDLVRHAKLTQRSLLSNPSRDPWFEERYGPTFNGPPCEDERPLTRPRGRGGDRARTESAHRVPGARNAGEERLAEEGGSDRCSSSAISRRGIFVSVTGAILVSLIGDT